MTRTENGSLYFSQNQWGPLSCRNGLSINRKSSLKTYTIMTSSCCKFSDSTREFLKKRDTSEPLCCYNLQMLRRFAEWYNKTYLWRSGAHCPVEREGGG